MKANSRKWKALFSLVSIATIMSAIPVSNVSAETASEKKHQTEAEHQLDESADVFNIGVDMEKAKELPSGIDNYLVIDTEVSTEDEEVEEDLQLSAGASAIFETNESVTENDETLETQLNAGAAVILDADISMANEQIVELVKNNTTDTILVNTLTRQESTFVMAKVNEYVNIRKDADKDAEKLGVMYKDCGGEIVERQGNWTKIKSGDVTGWVSNEYLYFGDDAESQAKEVGNLTAYSDTETLRVRKDPNLDGEVVGLLANGEAVEAVSESNGWVEVKYDGNTAYVSADYVDVRYDVEEAESMAAIKAREAAEAKKKEAQKAAEANRVSLKNAVLATASEQDILAALIQCEAGGESYEGQLAVGSVVMNRVRSGGYPSTITDVIYASGQFTPANSSKMSNLILNQNIKASCRQAAQEVVNGVCNVGDALHFKRAGNKEGLIIGAHVFY